MKWKGITLMLRDFRMGAVKIQFARAIPFRFIILIAL